MSASKSVQAPPADFCTAALKKRTIRRNSIWYRICRNDYPEPLGSGFGSSRFSDPDKKDFTVVYLGQAPVVCFNEVIWREDHLDPGAPPFDAAKVIPTFYLATIRVTQTLHVVDLTGNGPAAMRIPADVAKTSDHSPGQLWVRSLWDHPDKVDGILYRSRLNDDHLNLAIFSQPGTGHPKLETAAKRPLEDCGDELEVIFNELMIAVTPF